MKPEVAELRALTRAAQGANYEVWDEAWSGPVQLAEGLTRDVAIGFAMGLEAAGTTYSGSTYNPIVKCGAMVVWPEARWGEGSSFSEAQ